MKRAILIVQVVVVFALTGCTKDDILEMYKRQSGIYEDESYMQYQQWQQEEKLDEEGYYSELGELGDEFTIDEIIASDELAAPEPEHKQVHITFASNSYLQTSYYYDENQEQPIEDDYCYLDPGESIYTSQPKCVNPYTNSYVFAGYRIYEYDSDGKRGELLSTPGNVDKIFTIPEDYKGTELSIEPIGEYQKRQITFDTYRIDKDGNYKSLDEGTWKVDETSYLGGAELNPSETHTITYTYDSDVYYVVATTPEYFYDTDGVVEFPKTKPLDINHSYTVQLGRYLTLQLEGEKKKIASVKVNDEECTTEEILNKKLKPGDRISIETNEGYRLFYSGLQLSEPEEIGDNKWRYTFRIPSETNEGICIRVSKTDLTIKVEKNVGNDISFDISGKGFSESDLVYEKESFNKKHTIYDKPIGAEESISISAKGTLQPDHALRLDIEKKDRNGNKETQILYISSVPGEQTVDIYMRMETPTM